jgi:hypothetical protein
LTFTTDVPPPLSGAVIVVWNEPEIAGALMHVDDPPDPLVVPRIVALLNVATNVSV